MPGPVAQSFVRLIAYPGVVSAILAQSHTFVELITNKNIFTVNLLLIQEGLVSVTS